MISLDSSQKIQDLLNYAEKTTFAPHKFDNYCKAAKLQCASELIEDAKKTYTLAKRAIDEDKINQLLKLSKIAIMINPTTTPDELKKAAERIEKDCNWAERQPQGKSVLGETYALRLALLAKRYFQMGSSYTGNSYLQEAINWSNCGQRLIEGARTDLKIVKVCIKGNQFNTCLQTVKKMEKYIPLLELNYMKANYMLTLAELILPIDKDYGKTLLSKAEKWIDKNNEKEIDRLNRVTQLYNT
jgi:hypothetical protein